MKKAERFYFNNDVEKKVTRYTDYITPLHIKCYCVTDTYRGEKWRFGSFIRNYNIS